MVIVILEGVGSTRVPFSNYKNPSYLIKIMWFEKKKKIYGLDPLKAILSYIIDIIFLFCLFVCWGTTV